MNSSVGVGPGTSNAGTSSGGTTLSELYETAKRLQIKIRASLEKLERTESFSTSAESPALAVDIDRDVSQLRSLCLDMDRLWRSVAVKSQRDLWRRKVEQVVEEADSQKASLDKYFMRIQKRMQEAKDRADLLGRANGGSCSVTIHDDENLAFQSARNSSRMLEDAYSQAVNILGKFAEQRQSMKSAHRKLLDVLNTVGLSNSVLRLIERRNRVDTWIKYAGMVLTFIVLIVFWRWIH